MTTIYVETRHLARALDAARRIVPRKASVPILETVKITAKARGPGDDSLFTGHLVITATDLDCDFEQTVPAVVSDDAAFCVSLRSLRKAARHAGGASLRMKIDQTDTDPADAAPDSKPKPAPEITIEGTACRFTFATRRPEDFPTCIPADAEPAPGFAIDGPAFAKALRLVAPVASRESTRWYLNGVYLAKEAPGELAVVATDGHRLFRTTVPVTPGAWHAPAILPNDVVETAAHIAAGSEQPVVTLEGKHLRIVGDTMRLSARLIDGTYPNYRRLLPPEDLPVTRCDSEDLYRIAAAGKALLPKGHLSGVRFTAASGPDNPGIVASLSHEDIGTVTARFAAEVEGENWEVGLNPAYLLDTLQLLGVGRLTIAPGLPRELPDGVPPERFSNPVRFTNPERPHLLAIQMPMRV